MKKNLLLLIGLLLGLVVHVSPSNGAAGGAGGPAPQESAASLPPVADAAECVICREGFNNEHPLITPERASALLVCGLRGHTQFHDSCLSGWLNSPEKKCPLCNGVTILKGHRQMMKALQYHDWETAAGLLAKGFNINRPITENRNNISTCSILD